MPDLAPQHPTPPRPGIAAAALAPAIRPLRLMDQVRRAIRTRHLSPRTEEAYTAWVRRFIVFHGKRNPGEMAEAEVGAFLSSLASMAGVPSLVASLLYGSGLRVLEGLNLRVKDLDSEKREILIRDGKGRKDRRTIVPAALVEPLRRHLEVTHQQHEGDLRAGAGFVALPDALDRIFPATRTYREPTSGQRRRHHLHETDIQRGVREAAARARITIRHPPARRRLRHPHHPGVARPPRREHHHDLHPRPQPRPGRRPQPPRPMNPSAGLRRPSPAVTTCRRGRRPTGHCSISADGRHQSIVPRSLWRPQLNARALALHAQGDRGVRSLARCICRVYT